MSKQNGFWRKIRDALGQQDEQANQSPADIEIPQVILRRSHPDHPSNAQSSVDVIYLRQQMSNYLDAGQLTYIGTQLGIDYEQLPGGKGRKVLELINYCEQQGVVEDLLALCEEINPTVQWQM